jgi:tetratricopeptide (TPR) repeat protein
MQRLVLTLFLVLWSVSGALAGAMDDWRLAYDAQNRGDYAEAIRLYTQVIQSGELSGENLAKVYTNRAIAHHNADQIDPAVADYTKAIQIKADFVDAWVGRCGIYSRKQLYDQAIADCDRGAALSPDYFLAYYNRGVALYHKNLVDRSVADFTKAIALKPDYALAYSFRCYAYVAKAEHEVKRDPLLAQASADCNKALQLSPGEASATRSLARIAELRKASTATGTTGTTTGTTGKTPGTTGTTTVPGGGRGTTTPGGQTTSRGGGGDNGGGGGGLRQDGGNR